MTDVPAGRGGPERAEPLGVVVVSVDQGRLTQYRAALRMAGVTAALTADADEAETWLRERQPTSMVLDQGLPRMTVFRLYGLVRAEESMRGIAVLFVGQEGEGGAEDHYLPSDASPLVVAAQAQQLAAQHAESAREAETESGVPSWLPAGRDAGSAANSSGPWSGSKMPASDAEFEPSRAATATDEPVAADDTAEVAETPRPRSSGRRLDVILFRVGIVLLILGLVAVWLNPISTTPVQAPPTVAPATPSRPSASPSPASLVDPASGHRLAVAVAR